MLFVDGENNTFNCHNYWEIFRYFMWIFNGLGFDDGNWYFEGNLSILLSITIPENFTILILLDSHHNYQILTT
jgi:hypothetical protein